MPAAKAVLLAAIDTQPEGTRIIEYTFTFKHLVIVVAGHGLPEPIMEVVHLLSFYRSFCPTQFGVGHDDFQLKEEMIKAFGEREGSQYYEQRHEHELSEKAHNNVVQLLKTKTLWRLEALQHLYQLVLRPIRHHLTGASRLVIIPHEVNLAFACSLFLGSSVCQPMVLLPASLAPMCNRILSGHYDKKSHIRTHCRHWPMYHSQRCMMADIF